LSRIRIGKDHKRTLSLGDLPEIVNSAGECAAKADWEAILSAAGFDVQESELLQLLRVDRFSLREAAAFLGLSFRKVSRVKRRIDRRVANAPILTGEIPVLAHCSGVAFERHSRGSHIAWSLSPPNPIELVILRNERFPFWNQ
jgi:hypothetical protein